MTKARKATLDTLVDAPEPLSATAVSARLGELCDQATVYRTLHFLEEKGFAESFVLHCEEHGTERYYSAIRADDSDREIPHRHWFHCEACHRFIAIGACTVSQLVERFEQEQSVSVSRHVLYFTGLCSDCRVEVNSESQ